MSDETDLLVHKTIRLQVTLVVEGLDRPAHNFADSAIQAVRKVITRGIPAAKGLTIKIVDITENEEG